MLYFFSHCQPLARFWAVWRYLIAAAWRYGTGSLVDRSSQATGMRCDSPVNAQNDTLLGCRLYEYYSPTVRLKCGKWKNGCAVNPETLFGYLILAIDRPLVVNGPPRGYRHLTRTLHLTAASFTNGLFDTVTTCPIRDDSHSKHGQMNISSRCVYDLFLCVQVALPVGAQEENMLCSWRELLCRYTTCGISAWAWGNSFVKVFKTFVAPPNYIK